MAAAVACEDYAEAAALKQELAALGPAEAAEPGRAAAAAPARSQHQAATPGGPAACMAAAADPGRPSAPGSFGMYDRMAAGGRR